MKLFHAMSILDPTWGLIQKRTIDHAPLFPLVCSLKLEDNRKRCVKLILNPSQCLFLSGAMKDLMCECLFSYNGQQVLNSIEKDPKHQKKVGKVSGVFIWKVQLIVCKIKTKH